MFEPQGTRLFPDEIVGDPQDPAPPIRPTDPEPPPPPPPPPGQDPPPPQEPLPDPPPPTPGTWMAHSYYAPVRVFPDACGYGANAFSNLRGGPVELRLVTNLNNAGPGSLRAALSMDGPVGGMAFVVSKVDGVVELQSGIAIGHRVYGFFLTSPGQGLCVTRANNYVSGLLFHQKHNIVMVGLRVRYKAHRDNRSDKGNTYTLDKDARDFYLRNCSFALATDEAFTGFTESGQTVERGTLDKCFIGPLFSRGGHLEEIHDRGAMFTGRPVCTHRNISIIQCIDTSNYERNFLLSTSLSSLQVVNNLIHNCFRNFDFNDRNMREHVNVNMIGNIARPGPYSYNRYNWSTGQYENISIPRTGVGFISPGGVTHSWRWRIYSYKNMSHQRDTFSKAESEFFDTSVRRELVAEAHDMPATPLYDPGTLAAPGSAFWLVLQRAGVRRVRRNGVIVDITDALDQRYVNAANPGNPYPGPNWQQKPTYTTADALVGTVDEGQPFLRYTTGTYPTTSAEGVIHQSWRDETSETRPWNTLTETGYYVIENFFHSLMEIDTSGGDLT